MKLAAFGFLTLCATMLVGASATAQNHDPDTPPLKCDMGGVPKIYGGTRWLVYGCADNRTVVVNLTTEQPEYHVGCPCQSLIVIRK